MMGTTDAAVYLRRFEVNMLQAAVSLAVAAACRFASRSLPQACFHRPSALARNSRYPPSSVLNKVGKPYRSPMNPGPKCRCRRENNGMGGVGKMVRGKHWQFPVIVTGAMTKRSVWAIYQTAFLASGWTVVHEGPREDS